MAIEFEHNGRKWRTDTVEEAIALRGKLESADEAAWEAGELVDTGNEGVWTPDNVMDLLKSSGRLQKEFLKGLFENGKMTSWQARERLSLDSEISFAGVLSGLSKQLKKLAIKPWQLYTTEVSWDGKTKTRTFRLSKSFEWAATELGWPENWV